MEMEMRDLMKGCNTAARALGALALVASVAGSAGAQQTASTAPWRAWLGCWSAGAVTPLGVDESLPLVCVTPTASADAAQITTIADGKVISSQRVDASGREMPLDAKHCTGTQVGRWSSDGRRVYLNATATCDGVVRTTSGILAMSPAGEWLDVQGVRADGAENVRVARYRDIGIRNNVPADIAETLRNAGMSVQSARASAGATIGSAAVVEASKATSVPVAEAFVLERGQSFQLDATQLVALADAGVSPRITDAMIAVSNPQTFSVNRPQLNVRDTVGDVVTGQRVYVTLDRYSSPWGWGYGPYGYSRYGLGYDPYGYNSYNSYGLGYGNGYGYGYPGYVYNPAQVVIVRGSAVQEQSHGRVVKGRGYTSGERPASSSSTDRVERSSGSSTSGSSSGGAAASSGSNSSGSSGRTAKPRP
jgi:hypothetical protein